MAGIKNGPDSPAALLEVQRVIASVEGGEG